MIAAVNTPMVATLDHFWKWLRTGGCRIKHRDVTHGVVALEPNKFQQTVYLAMRRQALAERPIRLIILKARKPGCSTIVQAFTYFMVKSYPHIYAQVVAHTDPSTRDIFELGARMYVYDPDWAQRPKFPATQCINFMDEHDSQLTIRTFGGHFISSSANIQILHISELAKVPGDKQFVGDQMNSVLNSVSDSPMTAIIIESTANQADESGEYERRCRTAMAGRGAFEFVFAPWYVEPSYRERGLSPLPPLEDAKERQVEDELRARVPELDEAQLRWRRTKIDTLGGLTKFFQDYPSTPEEAFAVPQGRVFPQLRIETHHLTADIEQLVDGGYQLYRGVDWGGRDPFVCLLVAHNPYCRTRFSVDVKRCPNTWRELVGWRFDDRGRPADRDNHAVDALRYAVTHFDLRGHVHVAAEIYDPDFVDAGQSVADNAQRVRAELDEWEVVATVADRSRPDSINTFIAQGIPTVGYHVEGVSGRPGEIQYGVDRLSNLIVARFPIEYEPEPPAAEELHRRRPGLAAMTFGYSSPREPLPGDGREAPRPLAGAAIAGCARW